MYAMGPRTSRKRSRTSAVLAAMALSWLAHGALLGCATDSGVGAAPPDPDRGRLGARAPADATPSGEKPAATASVSANPSGSGDDPVVSGRTNLTGSVDVGEAAEVRRAIDEYVATHYAGASAVAVRAANAPGSSVSAVVDLSGASAGRSIQVSVAHAPSGWKVVSAAPLNGVK